MGLIVSIMCIVGAVLSALLYRTLKKTKRLEIERGSLMGVNARLLEEIDRLKAELDKYKDTEIKVALTLPEKRILLNALESPHYKARIQEPQTRRFIRIIYNTLRKKIQESIKE